MQPLINFRFSNLLPSANMNVNPPIDFCPGLLRPIQITLAMNLPVNIKSVEQTHIWGPL